MRRILVFWSFSPRQRWWALFLCPFTIHLYILYSTIYRKSTLFAELFVNSVFWALCTNEHYEGRADRRGMEYLETHFAQIFPCRLAAGILQDPLLYHAAGWENASLSHAAGWESRGLKWMLLPLEGYRLALNCEGITAFRPPWHISCIGIRFRGDFSIRNLFYN